jgi:hypothetical protein
MLSRYYCLCCIFQCKVYIQNVLYNFSIDENFSHSLIYSCSVIVLKDYGRMEKNIITIAEN